VFAAILVGVGSLAPGSVGENNARVCAGRLYCGGARLPAPVTITADLRGSISYRIERDGRVRRSGKTAGPFPVDAIWSPGTGVWISIRHRRLVVGRGGKRLWRSHGQIASRWQLGVVTVGSHALAFQHDHKLYLAPLSGAERPVASREMPLGWTRDGLYTYRYPGRQLLLRSDTGALLKTIARQPFGSDYVVTGGSLYFIIRGMLMSTHGTRTQRLASLARLRMSDPWLQPIGRLLELQNNSRLVVLRPDGSVFASTPLPRDAGQAESISSSLVVAPDARAVAFTAAAGVTTDPNAAYQAPGTETVYLLRPGAHTAVPVHTVRVAFKVCERGASLQWHGAWLLYGNSEGNLAAIDPTGTGHAIELGSLVRRLPGVRAALSANWSDQPAGRPRGDGRSR
jgi:hypothetical protein